MEETAKTRLTLDQAYPLQHTPQEKLLAAMLTHTVTLLNVIEKAKNSVDDEILGGPGDYVASAYHLSNALRKCSMAFFDNEPPIKIKGHEDSDVMYLAYSMNQNGEYISIEKNANGETEFQSVVDWESLYQELLDAEYK